MTKTICIVGAGPKAAAILARAEILRAMKFDVPNITVIEKASIGSAWSGSAGYSNGLLTLCNPAEKDVGFPYVDVLARDLPKPIAPEIFKAFSWSSYLVETGLYPEWVDRGRHHPTHEAWADYLNWVFGKTSHEFIKGEVTKLDLTSTSRWGVDYNVGGATHRRIFDGVVFTGVGNARRVKENGMLPQGLVHDPKSFWSNTDVYKGVADEARILVVGDGGAAGAIVAWLASLYAERRVAITSVSPLGTLLPRGDGYAERRWFSDPSDWKDLSIEHRKKLLSRTEAGVVSLRNKTIIDSSYRVGYVVGRAQAVSFASGELELLVDNEGDITTVMGDYLVNAMGFDPWSQLSIVSARAAQALRTPNLGLREKAEKEMQADLTFGPIEVSPGRTFSMPNLPIPALAGLAQGPGMATLGCLGLVASAILDKYI